MTPRFVELDVPTSRALKFWKPPVSSTVNVQRLPADGQLDLAAALALAAALQHFDGERARLRDA